MPYVPDYSWRSTLPAVWGFGQAGYAAYQGRQRPQPVVTRPRKRRRIGRARGKYKRRMHQGRYKKRIRGKWSRGRWTMDRAMHAHNPGIRHTRGGGKDWTRPFRRRHDHYGS